MYELDGDTDKEPVVHKPGTVLTTSSPCTVSFDPADLIDAG
ncbi:hypothetical protein [Nonomuraea gerenzanensis]|uniref:Uncharacterized protein n=1 Tax=Nonomuraea gerenzanensis TaxID=93944 RepID=A0A1M4E696_9ACTN|nr:hypothetical protein [Nonomuraea gerenzanensis]SBO94320.1 hypothetical protein BN4615_P3836 [Nonomuraea gerenzanensis]